MFVELLLALPFSSVDDLDLEDGGRRDGEIFFSSFELVIWARELGQGLHIRRVFEDLL